MRLIAGMLAAILLCGLAAAMPAHAQNLPRGSYMRSCTDIRIEGDRLVALCRRVDGRMMPSALLAFGRCVGDIGNNNGHLQCSYRGGPPAPPPPGYRPGPPPGPRVDCHELLREDRFLRHRLRDGGLSFHERRRDERRLDAVRGELHAGGCRI